MSKSNGGDSPSLREHVIPIYLVAPTETLQFNSEIEAILGISLYIAALYVWLILILSFLQTPGP